MVFILPLKMGRVRIRKRRRLTCSKCGVAFASGYINRHRRVCGQISNQKHSAGSTDDQTGGIDITGCTSPLTSSSDEDGQDDLSKAENESVFTTHNSEEIQTSFGVSIGSAMTEQFRVRMQHYRRYEIEDQEFFECFEPSEEHTLESNHQSAEPPPTEIWDELQDNQEDFHSSEACAAQDDPSSVQDIPISDENLSKCEKLVMWLILFLVYWQNQYAITDTALSVLIKFICAFFGVLGMFDNTLNTISKLFPSSYYKLKKLLGLGDDGFLKYVVCVKCKSLYKYEDCIEINNGKQVSKKCSFVPWPNHPHRGRRGKKMWNNGSGGGGGCKGVAISQYRTKKGGIGYIRGGWTPMKMIRGARQKN